MTRPKADRFRRDFLTNGLLKAVVALPGGIMPYRPGYRTALWVLARTPERERRGRILLADLSGQEMTERTLTGLTEDIGRWRAGGWDDDGLPALHHGVVVSVEKLNSRAGAALTPRPQPTTGARDRVVRMADLEVRLKELGERVRRESKAGGELRAHASLRRESSSPSPPPTTIALLSSGSTAVYGTPFTPYEHYAPWSVDESGQPVRPDEAGEADATVERLALRGLFNRTRLLRLVDCAASSWASTGAHCSPDRIPGHTVTPYGRP